MSEQQRCKGFIASENQANGGSLYWKVKVKDESSPMDGQYLIVASVHKNIALAKGLNVNFEVGSLDDSKGRKAARAVDVRLEVSSK